MADRVLDTPRQARIALAVLAALAVAAIVVFMTIDVKGSWSFVIPFRGTKVWALVLVGYAIAVSTVLFQTVTHNRILTPSIMGFDALYMLIQTLMVFLLGGFAYATFDPQIRFVLEVVAMVVFATALFRWLFSGRARSLHLLVLVGIVFGIFFRSLTTFMQRVINPNDFAVLQDAMFASFNTVDETLLGAATLAVLAASLVGWRIAHTFDVLGLGRETAINLGIDHRRTVTLILMLVAVLVSVSTALVGPVTFFGLLVANLAYLVTGTGRHAYVLPAAALIAIVCLIGGQVILEQVFGFNSALAIIIEFMGGITFIILLLRGARK